jgi:hypothetical protein
MMLPNNGSSIFYPEKGIERWYSVALDLLTERVPDVHWRFGTSTATQPVGT